MDVTKLNAGARLDPLKATDELVATALLCMAGSEDIDRAQRACEIITAAKPAVPDADGRQIVADLSDLMVRAALRGEDSDVLGAALERIALHDAGHVAFATWQLADHSARRHLAWTVAGHSAAAFAQWSSEAKDIGATYLEALAGQPRPNAEQALREGGAAAKRLIAIEEATDAYERLAASWRALRLLIGAGRDRSVFEMSSRFDRLPVGRTWEKLAREVRGQDLTVLDVAVAYDLTTALCFDSLAACDERAIMQDAVLKHPQPTLAGATRIKTADIDGDDSRLVRVGPPEGHLPR
jgi:hypothetical protein